MASDLIHSAYFLHHAYPKHLGMRLVESRHADVPPYLIDSSDFKIEFRSDTELGRLSLLVGIVQGGLYHRSGDINRTLFNIVETANGSSEKDVGQTLEMLDVIYGF